MYFYILFNIKLKCIKLIRLEDLYIGERLLAVIKNKLNKVEYHHYSLVNLVQQPNDEVSWKAYLEVESVKLVISVLLAFFASLVVIA